jgi:rhodanese-related sulfurtransferase
VIDASGRPGVDAVTVREARRALEEGAVLVDVRETDEWIAGHVADAIHLPLADVGDHLAELPADRVILVICRSGRRSASAAARLTGCGLRAINVSGGMIAWEESGLPVVTAGLASGEVPMCSGDVGTTTVVAP